MKTGVSLESLPDCERCGFCCMSSSLDFIEEDLERWWTGEGSAIEDLKEWMSAQKDRLTRRPEDLLPILNEWLLTAPSVVVDSNLGTYPIFRFIAFIGKHWGDLWFHPETRDELWRCPFLRKVPNKQMYRCTIFEIRPEMCRGYPGKCPESRLRPGLHRKD